MFRELESLYKELLPYDRTQRRIPIDRGAPDVADMETFLKEESKLEIPCG